MTVALDHLILPTHDRAASAAFLSRVLGLPAGLVVEPFISIPLDNGVAVDVMQTDDHRRLHLAFLVDDDTFDRGLAILRADDVPHWADPGRQEPRAINHRFDGRGVYFADPGDNNLEMLTRSMPLPG